ncbi:hypothetical protein [Methylobacter psychrophilus]|uniref:hypothetical protein n=1 Tax=Methylobacter psychrophilus TaxID=96941 RepID=UPI0021D4EA4D|nr:hypothetical protein [Methylobacter psychrophilus]
MNNQSNSQSESNTNIPAQTEQATPKLNVNFTHRHSIFGDEARSYHLNDCIGTLAYQATNVLTLVSGNFLGEEYAPMPSDDVIFWSIESAINTIKDIQAMVAAYHEVESTKNNQA